MARANATFSAKDWKRRPWDGQASASEVEGFRLGRVEMIHTYEGDIQGEGTLQYLFGYNNKGDGSFVALERVTGSINGKSGTFVLQSTGRAENGRLKQTITVVPDSGTDELVGLKGQAVLDCELHMDHYPIVFEYELS